jgi:peptidoglycan/LPS O-acetylase OafA/YrhL
MGVVAYHAFPQLVPGGFAGVDVFFVISGYLLSGIIQRELEDGSFSLSRFYLRRARRILPVFIVVATTTLLLGCLLLTPMELRSLGKHAVAAGLSVANVVLWLEAGYFANASEFKPLLHTWSLAVEEQFYLLWPLVLMALLKLPRWRLPVLGVLASLSLFVACLGVSRWPESTFFLLHTRAWELMLGALVALKGPIVEQGRPFRGVLSICGAAAILYAFFGLNSESAYPGANALLPCGGAVALIACGPKSFVSAHGGLSAALMVFVGRISYSLYLWHWPLLALARISLSTAELEPGLAAALVVAAFGLAVASWRYIETPFRRQSIDAPTALPGLAGYGGALLGLLLMAGTVYASGGFPSRVDAVVKAAEAAEQDRNPRRGDCAIRLASYLDGREYIRAPRCIADTSNSKGMFVVWGDSHADAIAPGLRRVAASEGWSSFEATASACPPLPGVSVVRQSGEEAAGCPEFNSRVLEHLLDSPDVRQVALVARWAIYSEASRPAGEGRRAIPFLRIGADGELGRELSRQILKESLEKTIKALRAAGKAVVLVGSVPEVGLDVPGCLAHSGMAMRFREDCSADARTVRVRQKFSAELVFSQSKHVCLLQPLEVFCGNERCVAEIANAPLYVDSNHLSATGADFLAVRGRFADCLNRVGP